jgi:hypothetical protein
MNVGPASDSDSDDEEPMRPAKGKRAVKVGWYERHACTMVYLRRKCGPLTMSRVLVAASQAKTPAKSARAKTPTTLFGASACQRLGTAPAAAAFFCAS